MTLFGPLVVPGRPRALLLARTSPQQFHEAQDRNSSPRPEDGLLAAAHIRWPQGQQASQPSRQLLTWIRTSARRSAQLVGPQPTAAEAFFGGRLFALNLLRRASGRAFLTSRPWPSRNRRTPARFLPRTRSRWRSAGGTAGHRPGDRRWLRGPSVVRWSGDQRVLGRGLQVGILDCGDRRSRQDLWLGTAPHARLFVGVTAGIDSMVTGYTAARRSDGSMCIDRVAGRASQPGDHRVHGERVTFRGAGHRGRSRGRAASARLLGLLGRAVPSFDPRGFEGRPARLGNGRATDRRGRFASATVPGSSIRTCELVNASTTRRARRVELRARADDTLLIELFARFAENGRRRVLAQECSDGSSFSTRRAPGAQGEVDRWFDLPYQREWHRITRGEAASRPRAGRWA